MRILLFALPLALTACATGSGISNDTAPTTMDSDGDGISDSAEADLGTSPTLADTDGDGATDDVEEADGTDPLVADTDGDGLSDGEEVALGSDGTVADTDGDGYTDYQESLAGSDPTDATSLIYIGLWPFNPNKDAMTAGDPTDHRISAGNDIVPRFSFIDQYGEMVDIYDFAQQGKPMIIDLSGAWCYWCNEAAKLIEGDPSALDGYGYDGDGGLKDLIANGTIYWITILDANKRGGAASSDTAVKWYDDYPNPYVPVLADVDAESTAWINPVGYPTMMYVDENMMVQAFSKQDYTKAFDAALDYAATRATP